MYLILHGKVGVFLEKNGIEIAETRRRAESLYKSLKETVNMAMNWTTLLKNVEFSMKEAVSQNLQYYPSDEHDYIQTIFTHFDLITFWSKELLYLLASNKPFQYFSERAFRYWMAASKKAGDIIGEQALLNKAPRNATLIALTDLELLTLDKDTFESYLGAAEKTQEERVGFFLNCFPTLSKRSINNFQCMFQKIIRNRGEVVVQQGKVV